MPSTTSTTLTTSKRVTLISTAPRTMLTEPPLRDVLISTILPSLTVAPVPKLEAQNWWYWWCWWYPSMMTANILFSRFKYFIPKVEDFDANIRCNPNALESLHSLW
ncbi:Uncharacterized protein BM_BM17272 [Brugia malayi]|uniref:Uncharacterized protein n=1 Tax=Brugia malayi TaxID=6279 RepID=A0A4E9FT19_BRUMA|nr:Uncharacterized protein BM_BM17272 [Brugia malayi]VIP00470.1 Uncharacterized protein BM_BM17272 [Brugia malayi]